MKFDPTNDAATYWLDVLLECNRLDHSVSAPAKPEQAGPTFTSRAFAIVLGAIADACRLAGDRQALTSTPCLPARTTIDRNSAVHGAAVAALSSLYSAQTALVREAARAKPANFPADAAWGRTVADAHLTTRSKDRSRDPSSYQYSASFGSHQADPVQPGQQPLGANWEKVELFETATLLKLPAAPGYTVTGLNPNDPQYLAALHDVRLNGHAGLAASARDKAMIGTFWGYDGTNQLGTPPRLYLQIVRELAQTAALPFERRADLFALVAIAMGDAGIQAWYNKYLHDVWRPVVGVRRHDEHAPRPSTAPLVGDPFWLPLGLPDSNGKLHHGTPGFPAYPSGHATFGAAALHIARLFLAKFGVAGAALGPDGLTDTLGFAFTSDEFNGENKDASGVVRPKLTREFDSLWEAILENGRSRVYLGVHWQFDSHPVDAAGNVAFTAAEVAADSAKLPVGGIPLGLRIANEIWAKLGSID